MLCGILLGEGHEQMVVENLHAERRKTGRHLRIGKAVDLLELLIEDVDRSVAEICRVQESAVGGLTDCQPLINGTATALRVIDCQDGAAAVYRWIPPGNGAVLGRKNKDRWGCHTATGDVESTSCAIEHLAARRS